jgi:hypothetical protein
MTQVTSVVPAGSHDPDRPSHQHCSVHNCNASVKGIVPVPCTLYRARCTYQHVLPCSPHESRNLCTYQSTFSSYCPDPPFACVLFLQPTPGKPGLPAVLLGLGHIGHPLARTCKASAGQTVCLECTTPVAVQVGASTASKYQSVPAHIAHQSSSMFFHYWLSTHLVLHLAH